MAFSFRKSARDAVTLTPSRPSAEVDGLKITLRDSYYAPGPDSKDSETGESGYPTVRLRLAWNDKTGEFELGADKQERRSPNAVVFHAWKIEVVDLDFDRPSGQATKVSLRIKPLE